MKSCAATVSASEDVTPPEPISETPLEADFIVVGAARPAAPWPRA